MKDLSKYSLIKHQAVKTTPFIKEDHDFGDTFNRVYSVTNGKQGFYITDYNNKILFPEFRFPTGDSLYANKLMRDKYFGVPTTKAHLPGERITAGLVHVDNLSSFLKKAHLNHNYQRTVTDTHLLDAQSLDELLATVHNKRKQEDKREAIVSFLKTL